jgi:hypothetical protein
MEGIAAIRVNMIKPAAIETGFFIMCTSGGRCLRGRQTWSFRFR